DGADPHGEAVWTPSVSTLRLLYLWADFLFGYWTRVWPVTARGGLVVSERWWWDMYVDPRRHRMHPMPRLVTVLARLTRAPDAPIVLDAPPEVILERKQELSFAEIQRQRDAWREVSRHVPHLEFIDATASEIEVGDAVVDSVIRRQVERN